MVVKSEVKTTAPAHSRSSGPVTSRPAPPLAAVPGKVLGEPMEIPGVGQYVSFLDTEGNRVSMLQPLPRR